ncbi:polysaccharide biosynthesis protein [Lacrimispora amygdalina]|uniref:Polysaccharide biosynthesis protein n=1 Tax=Lacrimispora amygdalina TaxID=253257 RepID=A0A3E2NHI0_9FIRM|nr:polysaccharide biosynthesis protein [Clostridium indicum]RFZ80457.1 polysaccharide biosynthesis protein [Clostridium indicum]
MENSRTSKKTNKRGSSNFLLQGIILAAAGIIVRVIGMFYRIPLADILGDEGNGYYSSAFSIYSILLIVSSYSLPTAVSKMVAVRMARKEYVNSMKVLKVSLFYGTVVGGLGAAVLWFGADVFANQFLKMPYTSYALKTLAPTVWIIAYLGVFRGYFQGLGTMLPTAVSQIFEQIVNAVISIYAAAMLFKEGLRSNALYGSTQYSYAFGAAGGTIGTGAGALAGLLFLLFLMFSYRPIMRRQSRRDRSGYFETYQNLSGVLILTVLPIVFSSVAYNISIVIDNSIYGIGMSSMGMGAPEIAANWGIYSGKYRLLFNIPVAIANSLASALIPSLSQAVAERSRSQIIRKISMVIRFSMIIAIPSTVGLTVLAGPICNLLFSRSNNIELIKMMIYGSSAVVFFSLSTVTNAVLQGINHMKTPLKNAVISLVLHVGILWLMLFPFKMGIYGVLYSNILFALTMCLLNGLSIRKYLNYHQEIRKTFFLPTLAAGIMGAVSYGVYFLVHAVLKHNIVGVLAAVAAAVIVYGVLLLKFQCVDETELNGFPGGRKLAGIARKYHLL